MCNCTDTGVISWWLWNALAAVNQALERDGAAGAQRLASRLGQRKGCDAVRVANKGQNAARDDVGEVAHLGATGVTIAVDEEVPETIRLDPALAPKLNGALQDIIGADQSGRAIGFDPLVIAEAAASAVGDDAELARRGLQDSAGGVDIAGFTDRRVDKATPPREHLDRLLAEKPAGHVEVVDGHVLEEPAGDF